MGTNLRVVIRTVALQYPAISGDTEVIVEM